MMTTTTTTSNILLFFTFIWVLKNYCLFPWRRNLQTKIVVPHYIAASANPRRRKLKDNPQGQGGKQLSQERRHKHRAQGQ